MKQSTYRMLVLVLTLIIVIGGSVLLYQNLGDRFSPQIPQETRDPSELAPDFTVQDTSDGIWQLSDFVGKPIVLNFWSSRCESCRLEMPHFEQAWQKYGEDIEIMMINLTDGFNDTYQSAMQLVQEQGLTVPVYFDLESQAAEAYHITGMPVTVFIDREGAVSSHHIGMISAQQLEEGIQSILAD